MRAELSKYAGFCPGVKRAVDAAIALTDKNVYILGDIIHNESVLKSLENKGIKTVYSIDDVSDGTVIIRSHGEGKKTFDELQKKGVKIVDMTCPFVKKIHDIVEKHHNLGYKIIIVGQKNHPEVAGINGWCDNSAFITDGEALPESEVLSGKICVVAQTTCEAEKFDDFLKKLAATGAKTVEIFKTICYTTMERQRDALDLSKRMAAMVVIGGKCSSNTNKLYAICKKNCANVFFAERPETLDYNLLRRFESVGIVSGASTPYEQSMEVFLTMEEKEANIMEQAVALLDEKQNLKKGQKISVVISQVNDDGLKVYFDGKTDITLPKEELAKEEFNKDDYKIGDEIEVVVMDKSPLKISQKQILVLQKEEEFVKELNEGKVFNVTVSGFNKGGLVGKIYNFNVFIPSREIKIGFVKDFEKYVGKTLRCKALKVEYTARRKEIVASQKVILEAEKAERDAERAAKEAEFFANVAENDIVSGTVARFAQFGAFVVVNGFDCLAHISDLAWNNVKSPADVLELGKTYDFVVLKVDKENKKVSIGYKQLQPKPWDLVAEKYAVGDVITGKVVRITDFGAFVEVEKGVDGLVHVSQISHEFLENAASALKVGEEVQAKILAINPEKERMTLSIKALTPAAEKPEAKDDKPAKGKKARKVEDPDNMRGWTESSDNGISIAELINK